MKVAAIDKGFVRAPSERAYERLRDPAGYPAWWPGMRSGSDGELWFPVLGRARCTIEVVKEGVELIVRIEGKVVRGHLLWYLEPFRDGTIVYGATDVETAGRWSARRVLRHRASMRDALEALRAVAG